MAPAVLGVFLVLTLWAGSPVTSEAGGAKIIIGGGHQLHPPARHLPRFHHQRTPRGHEAHPRGDVIIVPRTVVVVPSPPPRRWVPSYWTYQWVPQSVSYEAWVPGHWSAEGTWVPGHYELRTVSTGYYRPVRVGGYWVPD